MRSKTYHIPIHPISWKRAGLNGSLFFDKQKQEKLAVGLYLRQDHGSEAKFEGPLEMTCQFFMPQPRTVKDRTQGPYCWRTPDIDNLTKFLMDTINETQTIWSDDKQVASLHAVKIYDKNPRTMIRIRTLTEKEYQDILTQGDTGEEKDTCTCER